jgi:hypothetical protein
LTADSRKYTEFGLGVSTRLSGLGHKYRRPDVLLEWGCSELKFAGDRIDKIEIKMDAWLLQKGFDVRYDIVPHPFSGQTTPKGDLERLKVNCIPFKQWGPEFWSLGRGDGLNIPLTWAPDHYHRSH